MVSGPMGRYRELVEAGRIRADPAQRAAVEKLQLLHMRLAGYDPSRRRMVPLGWLGFGRKAARRDKPLTGLYIYGPVGRGKSMLMDLFFEGAPVTPKRRVHFHAFMQEVHVGIHIARESNVQDPVRPVADEIAEGATLLCFDEFQVTDIADAMILGRLFEALFDRGVVVVATSNRPPDDLYKDGLNRAVFLPFIAMLKERLDIHELAGPDDHRQALAAASGGEARYFWPLGARARAAMDAAWQLQAHGVPGAPLTVSVRGRRVSIPRAADEAGRAGFSDLCEKPLGPGDYLEIARQFRVFLLDDIPRLGEGKHNEARRLVTLVDAFYEARVKLYCSADAPPDGIFVAGEGLFEFARTASRLAEMQGAGWPGA
jgi:cell division protein ZapE